MTTSIIDPPYLARPYSVTVAEIDAWIVKLEKMDGEDEGVRFALASARRTRRMAVEFAKKEAKQA